MATQTIALSTPLAGLATPTLRVFPESSDTQVSGSPFTLIEATNCKGRYTVEFTGTLSGRHKVVLYTGSDVIGSGWVDLVNATGTYEVRSEYAGAAEMRSALGMAAADLDTQLDAILANTGTGARTVTITVNDGSTALEGASVRMIKGGENYVGATNASGQIVFSLDDGTWSVAISLAGYTFTPTTLAVSATTSHTYSMTAVTLTPSSPGLTTGYLTCYSSVGAALAGVVFYAGVSDVNDNDGAAYTETLRTATSAANGLVEFANLHKGLTYTFRRGSINARRFDVTIPTTAGSTYELPAILGE